MLDFSCCGRRDFSFIRFWNLDFDSYMCFVTYPHFEVKYFDAFLKTVIWHDPYYFQHFGFRFSASDNKIFHFRYISIFFFNHLINLYINSSLFDLKVFDKVSYSPLTICLTAIGFQQSDGLGLATFWTLTVAFCFLVFL